jgi:hypothetical protein
MKTTREQAEHPEQEELPATTAAVYARVSSAGQLERDGVGRGGSRLEDCWVARRSRFTGGWPRRRGAALRGRCFCQEQGPDRACRERFGAAPWLICARRVGAAMMDDERGLHSVM